MASKSVANVACVRASREGQISLFYPSSIRARTCHVWHGRRVARFPLGADGDGLDKLSKSLLPMRPKIPHVRSALGRGI